MTCTPCDIGKPDLLPGGESAFAVWARVGDQVDGWTGVLQQEPVWRVIDAMKVFDPLELFDQVMIIADEYRLARKEKDKT